MRRDLSKNQGWDRGRTPDEEVSNTKEKMGWLYPRSKAGVTGSSGV